MSNSVIGHIIGMDEMHKNKLTKKLPLHIRVIDLDDLQQTIYNHINIANQKKMWTQISQNINILKKQNKMIESKGIRTKNTENEINKLLNERNIVKKNIHAIWKNMMSDAINDKLDQYKKYHILFIGFNIFPKDYRIRINIPVPLLISPNNKIIFDIKPTMYASNQIKFYLKKYSDKIIRGVFPLNLLQMEYLVSKYEKFTQFYDNLGYEWVDQKMLFNIIQKLDTQICQIEEIPNNVYVATLYKSSDIIPVNSRTPVQGFMTKNEAIDNIQSKIIPGTPIYLYEINANQFHMIDGKLMAINTLNVINFESLLLT